MQTEQVNCESGDSGDVLAEIYIFHLKPKPVAISVLLCKLRSFNKSKNLLFLIILHACIGMHVNYVKFERHAWPYPPRINYLLIYKMPYPSYRFDDAMSLEIMFLYD